jgi:hypothetical protein
MTEVVLRVSGLKVACGGQSAVRSARARSFRPPLPVPPLSGRGRAMEVRA